MCCYRKNRCNVVVALLYSIFQYTAHSSILALLFGAKTKDNVSQDRKFVILPSISSLPISIHSLAFFYIYIHPYFFFLKHSLSSFQLQILRLKPKGFPISTGPFRSYFLTYDLFCIDFSFLLNHDADILFFFYFLNSRCF